MRETMTVVERNFETLALDPLYWRMAGHGGFHFLEGEAESDGGPGILWYPQEEFGDFILKVDWRSRDKRDNSGVFLRLPALGGTNPDKDWLPAVDLGCEVQIDDQGWDPEFKKAGDHYYLTGAVYKLAPASQLASHPSGQWNTFEIEARGPEIGVWLNGERVSCCTVNGDRRLRGYLGLQNHHPGSQVAFRNLRIRRL